MIDGAVSADIIETAEASLRADLARADAMRETIAPILRHLLASENASVFSEEIVARVRGILDDLARQLLDAVDAAGEAGAEDVARDAGDSRQAALSLALADHAPLLRHAHALALEWQFTERLHARLALDPVLPPLLQALIASSDGTTAALGMNLLAAQARFCQSQRRMQHALGELPGDLFHAVLVAVRKAAAIDEQGDIRSKQAEKALRAGFDESGSRLGLISRLVSGMGGGALAALSVTHGGPAIFLTALAQASGQDRDLVALSTNDAQQLRLALALRAGGLKQDALEQQILAIFPDSAVAAPMARIGPDRAAAILAGLGASLENR